MNTLLRDLPIDPAIDRLMTRHPRLFLWKSGKPRTLFAACSHASPGWTDIINNLFDQIDGLVDDDLARRVKVHQIKEKFGRLRVSIGLVPRDRNDTAAIAALAQIDAAVSEASKRSESICWECGGRSMLRSTDCYISTRCNTCRRRDDAITGRLIEGHPLLFGPERIRPPRFFTQMPAELESKADALLSSVERIAQPAIQLIEIHSLAILGEMIWLHYSIPDALGELRERIDATVSYMNEELRGLNWSEAVVHRYPRLFTEKARPIPQSVPESYRPLVERALATIDAALTNAQTKRFELDGIDLKYASLRLRCRLDPMRPGDEAASRVIDAAVAKVEAASEGICDTCGAPAQKTTIGKGPFEWEIV
ncbi:MAG: hypothetical protein WCA24_01695, partial [Thiomonas sp.]